MKDSQGTVDHRHDWTVVLVAWSLSAMLLGLLDFALVPPAVLGSGAAPLGALFFALLGNSLRVSLVGALGVGALLHVRAVVPRPSRTLPALVAALALPYAGWLSWFMFSGPQARAHPLRWPAVGLVALGVSLGAAAYAWLLLKRWQGARTSAALGCAGVVGAVLCLLISQFVRPEEYVPLHTFLGVCAILASGGGLTELARTERARRALTPQRQRVWALLVLCAALGSALAPSPAGVAWVVSSHTGFARYTALELLNRAPVGDPAQAIRVVPWAGREAGAVVRKRAAEARAPNVVLFFVDNVQANHVGAYGYRRRPTTPNIDALAQGGVVFERAFSVFPLTRNFGCMLLFGRFIPTFELHEFPAEFVRDSLPLQLAKRDYSVFIHALFDARGGASFHPEVYGLADYSVDPSGGEIAALDVDGLLKRVEAHVAAAQAEDRPYFVWVHLLRPHWERGSFAQPEAPFDFGDELLDLYDGNIATADAVLPRVEALVSRHPNDRETVWVMGSDHGAGVPLYRQGKTLLSIHTHVPLIIRAPGLEPRWVKRAVEVPLDLGPTILDLCGIETPASWEGVSLVPDLLGADLAERPALQFLTGDWLGLVYQDWKYVRRKNVTSLTDLSQDPAEMQNLSRERPEVLRRLDATARALLTTRYGAYRQATGLAGGGD